MFKTNPEQLDPTLWKQYTDAFISASTAISSQDQKSFISALGLFMQCGMKLAKKYHDHGMQDDEMFMMSHIKTHRDLLMEKGGMKLVILGGHEDYDEPEKETEDLDLTDKEVRQNSTHRWDD